MLAVSVLHLSGKTKAVNIRFSETKKDPQTEVRGLVG
jgi:hypothetical protein